MRIPLNRVIAWACVILALPFLFDSLVYYYTGFFPLPIPMYVGNELTLGLVLLGVGAVAIWTRVVMSVVSTYAPGKDVGIENGFYHQSVEQRRKARLPLREKFSVLPDRAVMFGMPVMGMMLVMVLMDLPLPSKGIFVAIAARGSAPATVAEQPVVVQVEKTPNPNFDKEAWPSRRERWAPVFRVQGQLIAESDLRRALKKELARRGDWSVFIYGDDDLPFQSVVEVVDVVNGLGGRPVLVGKRGTTKVE